MPGSNELREVGSAVVMGASGVLGRMPFPEATEEDAEEEGRPLPRRLRRIWLKLLPAFEVDPDEEEEAAMWAGTVCGVAKGDRKRLGSMMRWMMAHLGGGGRSRRRQAEPETNEI